MPIFDIDKWDSLDRLPASPAAAWRGRIDRRGPVPAPAIGLCLGAAAGSGPAGRRDSGGTDAVRGGEATEVCHDAVDDACGLARDARGHRHPLRRGGRSPSQSACARHRRPGHHRQAGVPGLVAECALDVSPHAPWCRRARDAVRRPYPRVHRASVGVARRSWCVWPLVYHFR